MRRRTRSAERTDKQSLGFLGRRAKSVERSSKKPKNTLLMHDDDHSTDSRQTGSRKYYSGASTRSGLDDDSQSVQSKKSGMSSWFAGGSTAGIVKSKVKKDWPDEEETTKQAIEKTYSQSLLSVNDIERMAQKRGQNLSDERFRVIPDDAYPNTFLNRGELRKEMNLKSVYFHDTRVKSDKTREIGQLRLEVLQCFGLPAATIMREVAAYCVAVCGSHAFKTDVMPAVANPMWLCKMRRACLFPIHHAYARLFIGVFDNSSETDFIGRIAIDIARLRGGCCYDFTLPLRQSSNVFIREQHGAIRIRLHLLWHVERNVVMSYIPKTKPEFRPKEKINVSCLDEQSFRNVAQTVHGSHMPGKFSMTLLKATIREVNFTRIHVMRYLRNRELCNLIYWQYPLISGFVFLAWMHSVYANATRYIPGHVLTYLLLHLYKNYAYYAMDSPLQHGFMPPTLEELFNAVVFGTKKAKKKFIQPLTMDVDESHAINPEDHLDPEHGKNESSHNSIPLSDIADALRKSVKLHTHKYRLKTFRSCFVGSEAVDFLVQSGYAHTRLEAVALGRKLARDTRLFEHVTKRYDFEDKPHYYQFLSYDSKKYMIKGHRPKFKRVLKALFGFSEEDPLLATRGHMEFPFATGTDHPRFTVKEALVIRSNEVKKMLKEKNTQQDIVDCAEFGVVPAPPLEANPAKAQQFITNAAGEVVNVAATLTTGVMSVGMGAVGGAVGVVRAGVRRASLLGSTPSNMAKTEAAKSEDQNEDDGEKQSERTGGRMSFGGGTSTANDLQKMEVGVDPDDVYSKLRSRHNTTLDELLEQQAKADAFDRFAYDSDDDVEDTYKKKSKGFIIEEKILRKPVSQDMGIKAAVGDKTFAKTMAQARHKAHGFLLHLFNDRTYFVNQEVFPPNLADDKIDRLSAENGKDKKKKKINILRGAFGGGGNVDREKDNEEEEEKKKRKRQITPFDAKVDEFDRTLGINKYSHPNPWINRVGIIVQPVVEIVQSWLYLIRAIFNVFTWQDPILSFWVAVLGPVVVLALHLLPYRIFFFLLGVAAVGPQNLLLRLWRESKGDPPPDFDKLFRTKKIPRDDRVEESQYFSSEAPGNQHIKYINVDPKQVRNVVVPYGPLKYNRFYEWPPEPQYARVYASLPPRNSSMDGETDDDDSDEEGYEIDARTVKAKKKKKKKGIKKLASQVKKGTGTVVVAGGELAKRTQKITAGTVTGAVGLAGGAVMGTAHLTTTVAKGAVGVTKGAVKGTVKGAAKGAKGVLNIGKRGNKYDYDDDDDSY